MPVASTDAASHGSVARLERRRPPPPISPAANGSSARVAPSAHHRELGQRRQRRGHAAQGDRIGDEHQHARRRPQVAGRESRVAQHLGMAAREDQHHAGQAGGDARQQGAVSRWRPAAISQAATRAEVQP